MGVGWLAVVAAVVMMVVAAVMPAVVALSLRMILCVHILGFSCFMKRRDGPMDGWTDLHSYSRTYGRIYGRKDRPSYRVARMYQKIVLSHLFPWLFNQKGGFFTPIKYNTPFGVYLQYLQADFFLLSLKL